MKKMIIIAALIAMTANAAAAQERVSEPVLFVPVAGTDNLFEITGGRGCRCALFIGDGGAVLIDTKMDEASMRRVMDGIAGLTDKPLVYLINTHSDGDHVNGNPYVPEDVAIVAHENCRREFFHPLRNGNPSGWDDPARAPFIPEITFNDRMTLHLGRDRLELFHFGAGHTSGDAVIVIPSHNIAVVGDQYAGGQPPYIHDFKGGSASGHIDNLRLMLETLDCGVFLSGHAAPVGRAEIEAEIADMQRRFKEIGDARGKGASLDTLTDGLDRREALLIAAIWSELE